MDRRFFGHPAIALLHPVTSHGASSPLLGYMKRDVTLRVEGRYIAEGIGCRNPTCGIWRTESWGYSLASHG